MPTEVEQLVAVEPGRPLPWRFSLAIRQGEDGRIVGRTEVPDEDLDDSLAEAWLGGVLRKGRAAVPFERAGISMAPVWASGGGPRVAGFLLETRCPDAGVAAAPRGATRLEFPLEAFRESAHRYAQELAEEKKLSADETFVYEIDARRRSSSELETPPAGDDPGEGGGIHQGDETHGGGGAGATRQLRGTEGRIASRSAPLVSTEEPLPPLIAKAKSVDELPGTGGYPVLYAEGALARAEALARKGGSATPPVETGGVLVGRFCSCPETGEFYAIVVDALEARDAVEDRFSLSYTGMTWTILRNVLKVRQRSDPALRIVGQAHGHPFPPAGGAPPCEACATAKVCGRTNVFVSTDDRRWSRAVFHRQPWQLCQIFGLNARGDRVSALFGLKENRLLERGFHVLRDDDVPSCGTLASPDDSREEANP